MSSIFSVARALGKTDLFRVIVENARDAYEKHQGTCESKGIKAHFQLDDNSLLVLDRVSASHRIFHC